MMVRHVTDFAARVGMRRGDATKASSPDRRCTVPVSDDRPNRQLSEVKAALFKALAHPARIRALEVLADGPRTVSELQPFIGIESSSLSHQLAVLRRTGLVSTNKVGSSVVYSLADPLVAELLAVAKRLLLATLAPTRDLIADLSAEMAGP